MRWSRAAWAALGWTLAAGAADGNGPMSSAPLAPASAVVGTVTQPGAPEPFDVKRLFATTCGWCHSNGGRAQGRGPKLMGTPLTDAEIVGRIKAGKTGAMPSFATAFNDDQLQAIVSYIRGLKPDGGTP